MYTIDIIDDSKIVSAGFKNLIEAVNKDFKVRKIWHNGYDFLLSLRVKNATKPDMVIIDYRMPVLMGYHVSYVLQRDFSEIKKIGYSSDAEPKWINNFIATGCKTFIDKSIDAKELEKVLKVVARDEYYYNFYVTERLTKELWNGTLEIQFPYNLTDNEYLFIHLCQSSLTREQFADVINIKIDLLHKKQSKLYKTFGVKTHGEMVSVGIEKKIIKHYKFYS